MALQISPKDTDLLLKQKNVLSADVLDKYRYAGEVTQTCLQYIISLINDSYHLGKHEPYSAAELCLLGDSFMQTLINGKFKKVIEKSIAQPVTLDVNDLVVGYSPELTDDEKTNLTFKVGDIVTINLGCHIDGYTSNLAHTIVIFPSGLTPPGPLLGESSDAIVASYLANETIVTLLACALKTEKIPNSLLNDKSNRQITGSIIRNVVNAIAESFNCTVVPTSKVRRIRRFLAGQAEGVVAERDFKGVVWSEIDQEKELLKRCNFTEDGEIISNSNELITIDQNKGRSIDNPDKAIPTDDFVILPGEVYMIDIKMAPINKDEPGLYTLESLDGKTKEGFNAKHSIFIRDVSMSEQLKLRNSRRLLSLVDKHQSVYPFKLSYVSENFPLNSKGNLIEQLNHIEKDVNIFKFGLNECINKQLFVSKAILSCKFIPLKEILKVPTSTGINGYDAANPTLPGMELPLPKLGITSLKLKTLFKYGKRTVVSRYVSTVALSNEVGCVRLSGGNKLFTPSWVHTNYQLQGSIAEIVNELSALTQDERFGIKIDECNVLDISNVGEEANDMEE
ncbi:putative metalloprotease arx1 [Pichia californica]|uniref:Probable metalloprotease ARX1 n=1 Tax=Pichia californica TaxID=460514 RepID=A0A9P6WLL3_9ASCO|nr:putative metalloprotease arx1 [[Candida] californica]